MEKKKESVIVEEHNLPDARHISFSRNTTDIPERQPSAMSQNMFVMLLVVFFIFVFGLILYLKNTTGYKAASSKAEAPVSVDESLAQVTPQASASTTTVVAPASVDISNWKTFSDSNKSFMFQYPTDFTVSESEKNYYVLTRGNAGEEERIVVDARLTSPYTNYNAAVASVKKLSQNPQIEDLPNGIRVVNTSQNTSTAAVQYVMKYKTGALSIEYWGDPADTILDQIFATFEFTR